jgi:hypothetical protein
MAAIEQYGGNGGSLIKDVTLIETVVSYVNGDVFYDVIIDAVEQKNKQVILRTVGNLGTNWNIVSNSLQIRNFDLLKGGESIIITLDQKGGFGNVPLLIFNANMQVILTTALAPFGTYLITRTGEVANVLLAGFKFTCLDKGHGEANSIPNFVGGRKVGFGLYVVDGNGMPAEQVVLPSTVGREKTTSQKVILLVRYNTCVVSVPYYQGVFGWQNVTLAPGVHEFTYINHAIYLKS